MSYELGLYRQGKNHDSMYRMVYIELEAATGHGTATDVAQQMLSALCQLHGTSVNMLLVMPQPAQ